VPSPEPEGQGSKKVELIDADDAAAHLWKHEQSKRQPPRSLLTALPRPATLPAWGVRGDGRQDGLDLERREAGVL
jgi:hypothetical protein